MVDLCYHHFVKHDCRFGDRCRFAHTATYDPKTEYFTCTPSTRCRVSRPDVLFGIKPTSPPRPPPPRKTPILADQISPATVQTPQKYIIVEYKEIETDHDGYCSGADDFYKTELIDVTRVNETRMSGQFKDSSGHCCCGCKTKYEIIWSAPGLSHSDDSTPRKKVLAINTKLCPDLMRHVLEFLPTNHRMVLMDREPIDGPD